MSGFCQIINMPKSPDHLQRMTPEQTGNRKLGGSLGPIEKAVIAATLIDHKVVPLRVPKSNIFAEIPDDNKQSHKKPNGNGQADVLGLSLSLIMAVPSH